MSRGNLEHTEEILYKQSREDMTLNDSGPHINAASRDHDTDWESKEIYNWERKQSSSLSFKIFIFSSFVFIFASAFVFYKLKVSPLIVDTKKISMNLSTESLVEGGQEKILAVAVGNNNDLSLEDAKLTLLYDKGGSVSGDVEKITETRSIGNINPHQVVKQDFKYTLYGALQEKRALTVRLDYKIKGSNAIFPKESSTEVVLSTPLLMVTLEGAQNVISGAQNDYTLILKNATATTSPLSFVTLSTPKGFSLIRSSDVPIEKTFSWIIPSLPPSSEKRIALVGTFSGSLGEKASLKATVGSKKDEENQIKDLFSYDTKDIIYSKPGLSTKLSAEADRGVSTSFRRGDTIKVTVHFKNESQTKLSYVNYIASLPSGVDPRQIYAYQNGYYDISSRSIIWSSDSFEKFLNLGSGESGDISFSFVIPSDYKENSLPLEIKTSAIDINNGKKSETINDFSYRITGTTAFNSYTVYYDTAGLNTGPIPPRVETETTYTAVLSVSSQVDIYDAKAAFTIPTLYVKYLGSSSASSTSPVYDAKTKTVLWNIGTLQKDEIKKATVKLSIKPSLIHLGTTPSMSSNVVLTAINQETKEPLQIFNDPLTTDIKDAGPIFSAGNVVK